MNWNDRLSPKYYRDNDFYARWGGAAVCRPSEMRAARRACAMYKYEHPGAFATVAGSPALAGEGQVDGIQVPSFWPHVTCVGKASRGCCCQ